MNAELAEKTVGELVTEKPSRSRVFEEYGIDYCCGGKRLLSKACEKKGHNLDEILEKLATIDAQDSQEDRVDYNAMPLDTLAEHIVTVHHGYLKRELPRLREMSAKVARVHGESDARLEPLAEVVDALVREMESHMLKEEQMLFPVIQQLENATERPETRFGSIANPIRMMESEHDESGDHLEQMRTLTDGFTPPDWACNTYRALLGGLHDLEMDLHQHIHKENNILFPRAIEVESALP